jgi:hypothetical protein
MVPSRRCRSRNVRRIFQRRMKAVAAGRATVQQLRRSRSPGQQVHDAPPPKLVVICTKRCRHLTNVLMIAASHPVAQAGMAAASTSGPSNTTTATSLSFDGEQQIEAVPLARRRLRLHRDSVPGCGQDPAVQILHGSATTTKQVTVGVIASLDDEMGAVSSTNLSSTTAHGRRYGSGEAGERVRRVAARPDVRRESCVEIYRSSGQINAFVQRVYPTAIST